jgi:hypothetical protein
MSVIESCRDELEDCKRRAMGTPLAIEKRNTGEGDDEETSPAKRLLALFSTSYSIIHDPIFLKGG